MSFPLARLPVSSEELSVASGSGFTVSEDGWIFNKQKIEVGLYSHGRGSENGHGAHHTEPDVSGHIFPLSSDGPQTKVSLVFSSGLAACHQRPTSKWINPEQNGGG